MRASGLLSEPAQVEDADHVCWAYEDDAAFEDAAVRFLRAGLDRGERLMWVGDGAEERLRRAGGALAEVDQLRARGALDVIPLSSVYAPTGSFSLPEQLAFYGGRTDQARADGYRGLRVVAEVTDLATNPRHAGDFLRWEHMGDELAASGSGFVALCAYRAAEVDDDVLADAAALHPASSVPGTPPPFQLWFERDERGQRIAVTGEIDVVGADRFRRLLGGTHVDTPVVTVDLSRVTFIDLAGARAIAAVGRAANDRGGRLVLEGSSRLFRRIWAIIGLADAAEVSFPERSA